MIGTLDRPTWQNARAAARITTNQISVHRPYEVVVAAAVTRAEKHAPGDHRVMACLVTACLIRHRQNCIEYGTWFS